MLSYNKNCDMWSGDTQACAFLKTDKQSFQASLSMIIDQGAARNDRNVLNQKYSSKIPV